MSNALTAQKQKFSVAITTEGYKNLIKTRWATLNGVSGS